MRRDAREHPFFLLSFTSSHIDDQSVTSASTTMWPSFVLPINANLTSFPTKVRTPSCTSTLPLHYHRGTGVFRPPDSVFFSLKHKRPSLPFLSCRVSTTPRSAEHNSGTSISFRPLQHVCDIHFFVFFTPSFVKHHFRGNYNRQFVLQLQVRISVSFSVFSRVFLRFKYHCSSGVSNYFLPVTTAINVGRRSHSPYQCGGALNVTEGSALRPATVTAQAELALRIAVECLPFTCFRSSSFL